MAKYTQVRNPQWIDESREQIICGVYFEHLGEEVEFVADPNDVELHGREIFHRCVSGEFGELTMAPLERTGGLLRVADILPQAEKISDMPEREREDLEELQRYLDDANSENATGTERGVVLVWASIIDDVLAGVFSRRAGGLRPAITSSVNRTRGCSASAFASSRRRRRARFRSRAGCSLRSASQAVQRA